MKTFSKMFFTMVLAIALTCLLAPKASAQLNCTCDPDVPFLTTLPHPAYTGGGLHEEGRYIYQTTDDTVFKDLHFGANSIDSVDPCDPWILDFYVKLSEQSGNCVVLDSIVWNWETTMCQYFWWEFVHPANYVLGDTSSDYVEVHFFMKPHERTDWLRKDTATAYMCLLPNGKIVYPYWWTTCMHERINVWGHDLCPIPNTVIGRIEWDKPLPVELTSFAYTVSGNKAILNWTTAKETNNSGFAVERYAEGIWTEVGFVKGNGTTSLPVDYTYTDKNLNSGLYGYRLKQVDFNGNFEYLDLNGMVAIGSPDRFTLSQNYPNPFNPTTTIVYGIPNNGPVTLKVYDNLGREVRTLVNEPKTAGFYTLTFSAPDLSSGVYFYKLESGNFVTVKRMILMK